MWDPASYLRFGGERFEFVTSPAPAFRQIYDMVMDSQQIMGDSLFESEFRQKHQEGWDLLFERLTSHDDENIELRELQDSITALHGLPVRFILGGHERRDFTDADMVFASPAVRQDSAYLMAARTYGVPIDTEMNLFMRLCRGSIIGVTGSNGKTTTTSLIGAILRAQNPRTQVGGNIGHSLLPEVEHIEPGDPVVEDPAQQCVVHGDLGPEDLLEDAAPGEHLLLQDPGEVRVGAHEPCIRAHEAAKALLGGGRGRRVDGERANRSDLGLEQRPVEPLFGAEVVADHRDVDARAPRDLAHRRRREPALGEERLRRLEDPCLCLALAAHSASYLNKRLIRRYTPEGSTTQALFSPGRYGLCKWLTR